MSNVAGLYSLAIKVKQAWIVYIKTEKVYGDSEQADGAFERYEDAEHELLQFIFDKLD